MTSPYEGPSVDGIWLAKDLFGQGFQSAKANILLGLLGQVCSTKNQYLAKIGKYSLTKIGHIRKRSAQIRNLRITFK